jgi:hypothetical protein
MSNHQHSPLGVPNSIDARLRGLFRSLDTTPGFEARVLEQVRAHPHSAVRSSAAAAREQQLYRESMSALQRWRRIAVRSLTLDALAAGALVMLVTAELMHSQPELHGWIQSAASLASASSVQWLVTLLGAAVGLAPLVVPRFKRD